MVFLALPSTTWTSSTIHKSLVAGIDDGLVHHTEYLKQDKYCSAIVSWCTWWIQTNGLRRRSIVLVSHAWTGIPPISSSTRYDNVMFKMPRNLDQHLQITKKVVSLMIDQWVMRSSVMGISDRLNNWVLEELLWMIRDASVIFNCGAERAAISARCNHMVTDNS
jgi:hypothetical protein